MADRFCSMKRTKALVSKSHESSPPLSKGKVCRIKKLDEPLQNTGMSESKDIVATGTKDDKSGAPVAEQSKQKDLVAPLESASALTMIDPHEGLDQNIDIRKEEFAAPSSQKIVEVPLPDSVSCSPDEYLLDLVKAQLGVELESKQAASLKDFFMVVTEENMAAYTMEVVAAVRNNDIEELKRLSKEGQPLDCFNRFGESLLNMACRRGFEAIAQYLMESGELDVRICDDCGRTPLHDACWNPSPQLAICRNLLEREPALFLIADKRGCTAFEYARKEHWDQWRTFLYENKDCLRKLGEPEILSRFSKC